MLPVSLFRNNLVTALPPAVTFSPGARITSMDGSFSRSADVVEVSVAPRVDGGTGPIARVIVGADGVRLQGLDTFHYQRFETENDAYAGAVLYATDHWRRARAGKVA